MPSDDISVTVNGDPIRGAAPARQLLIHFLRDTAGVRGPHIGCDTGNCGACTVTLDGALVKSCMLLAVQCDGREVTTVEGISPPDGSLSALQRAFRDHHAVQCGYCTPGMLMTATDLLADNPAPTEDEVRHALKGNICRCTGYVNIVRAVLAAAEASS